MSKDNHSSEDEPSKSAPPTYHALTRAERDHLLATHHLNQENELPNMMDIQRRVEAMRGESDRPSNTTTYSARDTLVEAGWLERVDHSRGAGYRLTSEGEAMLAEAFGALDFESDTDE